MTDAHTDESGAPPVTICCATSDGAAVSEAAEALMARGHQVELAVGVDVDHAVLTRAIAEQRGRGLYVLCRSHALDRNAVDELREVLRTHDVPFGRTLTLAVDTQRPREVEERIVSVLRRMVTGRADGKARTWGTNAPRHEEDPDTTIRRPGGSPSASDPQVLVGLGTEPENADPYASTSQIEVAYRGNEVVPPAYTGAEHTAIGPAPQPPAAAATQPPAMPVAAPQPPVQSAPVPAPSLGGIPSPVAPPVAPPPPMPVAPMPVAPMPVAPMPVAPMPVAPMQSAAPSSAMAASYSSPLPMSAYAPRPVTADDPATDFDEPMTTGGRMGRAIGSPAGLALVLGGLVIVALVIANIIVFGGDDEDAAKAASAATAATEADEAGATKAGAKAEANAKAEPDKAKPDATKPDAAEPDAAEPDATKPDATEPDAAEPDKAEPDAKPNDEPEADEEPPFAAADPGDAALPARTFAPEDDPPDVVAALRSREIRAIDVWVVAPERKGTLTFEQAASYCKDLEVAGLTGWRVPTIGELNALATAKMLTSAIFWSSTAGDSFGDLRLVLGTKKGTTIVAVPKTWDGAKIVCIRPRQPKG